MLLKQLLESPKTSSKLVVYDPFQEPDQEALVKEVIGLANADVDGPRNILFGINTGAVEGSGIVGIAESAIAELKKAHRLLSALIEPIVHLAFIYDRINGKLVGTLEIDGCDEGPYIVARDFSEALSRGQCWVREGYELRAIEPANLAHNGTSNTAIEPAKSTEPPPITVGFEDQPDCELIEMPVPDTSDPPFAAEEHKTKQSRGLKKTIKEAIGTVTTQILRLGHASRHDALKELDKGDTDTHAEEGAERILEDANNHYFFEEKALQVNLVVCNKGSESVEDIRIELGFPRPPDFDIADRLYISPFDKRSAYEIKNLGYPEVKRRDDAILVRSSIGRLAPDSPQQAFKCALRLAVGPGMQGKKIAIHYKLRDQNKQSLGNGRLKIKFGQVAACSRR